MTFETLAAAVCPETFPGLLPTSPFWWVRVRVKEGGLLVFRLGQVSNVFVAKTHVSLINWLAHAQGILPIFKLHLK
jgi:hypothetical protein